MVIYMYIAPGQGQTTPWAQNIFFNINLLSICSFLASFLPFYIFLFFPIPMHGRPKLTCCKIGQGHPRVMIDINFVELYSKMLHTKFQNHRPSGSEEEDF